MFWAVLTAIIFACSNLFIRFRLAHIHWLSLIWWRSLASSCLLLIFLFVFHSASKIGVFCQYFTTQRGLWIITWLTGFLGILGFIKAIKALPLFAVIPFTTLNIAAVAVSYFYLQIPVTQGQLIGIFIGTVGLFLIYFNHHDLHNAKGWNWLIITVICWGISYPLAQPLIQSTSPFFFATTVEVTIFMGSTLLLMFGKKQWKHTTWNHRPDNLQYAIVVALLICGVLGNGHAREFTSPILMLAFSSFSEIGLFIVGHFQFNERLKPLHWTGAILTILAMLLVF
ncbi:MAG: hypothetical protein FJ333_00730 [Sphingomonadales bacterium]|nr:hypothetical protein [Sphingomonadales bacterium]